eukprot:1142451-Pelagomonas_calceolata.AAC.4
MDACRKKRLLEQDVEVPESVSRTIPDWDFPNGTGSSARHHSRPDKYDGDGRWMGSFVRWTQWYPNCRAGHLPHIGGHALSRFSF